MFINAYDYPRVVPPEPTRPGARVERVSGVAAARATTKVGGRFADFAARERTTDHAAPRPAPAGAVIWASVGKLVESPLDDGSIAAINAYRSAELTITARAMASAAKLRGPITDERLRFILRHLHEIGAGAADRDFVMTHRLGRPDPAGVAAMARDAAGAVEALDASALMLDPARELDAEYLADLRTRLRPYLP